MNLLVKRTLTLSIKLSEEFRAIFYQQQSDTLQDVYTKHKIINVYGMFIVDVVKEGFKQLRLKFPKVIP